MFIDTNKVDYDGLYFDEDVKFFEDKYEFKLFKDLKNVHINGKIFCNYNDNLEINMIISGIMVLNDSCTNELIDYPFNIDLNEELEEFPINEQNLLDLKEILWQNIVLEVPIRTSKSNKIETISGDGWSILDENSKKEDPRLDAFKALNLEDPIPYKKKGEK